MANIILILEVFGGQNSILDPIASCHCFIIPIPNRGKKILKKTLQENILLELRTNARHGLGGFYLN